MPSTSIPRAATSVAIRTWCRPLRNPARAVSRWLWLRSPWIRATSKPAWPTCRATRSARRFVRTKTRTDSMSSLPRRRTRRDVLRCCATGHVVQKPAWCRDDDVDPRTEGVLLRRHAHAPIDRVAADAGAFRKPAERHLDLGRKLARRG